jgi:hypothetical protein
VEFDREDSREMDEVSICRQNAQSSSHSRCTDQEVRVGTLDAFCSASVEEGSGFLVVLGFQQYVWKGAKMSSQGFELILPADPREKFLSDWPEHRRSPFPHQLGKFSRLGVGR